MFDGVTVDSRETRTKAGHQEVVQHLQQMGTPVESQQLQVGDYWLEDVAGGLVLVSRKSADFIPSLYDGHFSDELERCITTIKAWGDGHLFFLLEGPWATADKGRGLAHFKRSGKQWFRRHYESGASPKVLPGTQISLQTAGVNVITSNSVYDSALALTSLWERARAGWPTKLTQGLRRPELRWHKDGQKALRLMSLWPHLREEVAFELLRQYESVGAVLDAARQNPKDLLLIKGIGKTGLNNLLEVIN